MPYPVLHGMPFFDFCIKTIWNIMNKIAKNRLRKVMIHWYTAWCWCENDLINFWDNSVPAVRQNVLHDCSSSFVTQALCIVTNYPLKHLSWAHGICNLSSVLHSICRWLVWFWSNSFHFYSAMAFFHSWCGDNFVTTIVLLYGSC